MAAGRLNLLGMGTILYPHDGSRQKVFQFPDTIRDSGFHGGRYRQGAVNPAKIVIGKPEFAYYDFCRIHKTIRVTPAMEAGIMDHVWELAELLA